MFKNRAAASMAGIFAIGIVAAAISSVGGTSYFCAVAFAVCAIFAVAGAIVIVKKPKYFKIIAACAFALAAFTFGVFRVSLTDAVGGGLDYFNKKTDKVTIVVSSVDVYTDSCVFEGSVSESSAKVPEGTVIRLQVSGKDGLSIRRGDSVTAALTYYTGVNLSSRADGVRLRSYGKLISTEKGDGLLYGLRNAISDICERVFTDTKRSVSAAKAVTAGDRSGLDSFSYAVFANAGISHLLAISGLHISIITSALYYFICAFGVNRRISGIFGAVFALFYAALVGFTPGAVRAAVMMCIVVGSRTVMRRSDSITAMFAALFLLLMINPYAIFSLSLQLSFLSCLGVIVVGPYISRYELFINTKCIKAPFYKTVPLKLLYLLTAPALVTVAATLFAFPVTYLHFNVLSYVAPLVNVFAVPAYTYAIIITFAALLLYPLLPGLSAIVAYPADLLFRAVNNAASGLYASGVGSVSLKSEHMAVMFAVALAGIFAVLFARRHRAKVAVSAFAAFALAFAVCSIVNASVIGSSVSVEYGCDKSVYAYVSNKGAAAYIDMGGKYADYETVFVSGNSIIDNYVIPCYDSNSVARFETFSARLRVRSVIAAKPENAVEYRILSSIKQLANQRNCDIIEIDPEIVLEIGGDHLRVSKDAEFVFVGNGGEGVMIFNGVSSGIYNCDAAIFTGSDALGTGNVNTGLYIIDEQVKHLRYHTGGNYLLFNGKVRLTYRDGKEE